MVFRSPRSWELSGRSESPEGDNLGKKKRALSRKEEVEPSKKKKERPWWARTDAELVKDRVDRFKEVYDSMKVDVDDEDRGPIIKEAVKRDPRIVNLLDMVPVGSSDVIRDGEFILLPVYESERGAKIAGKLGLKTQRKSKLDDYGMLVWKLIDGKRDVRKIGQLLKHRFGKDVEPLYPRLSKFLAYLQNLKVIEITKPRQ